MLILDFWRELVSTGFYDSDRHLSAYVILHSGYKELLVMVEF